MAATLRNLRREPITLILHGAGEAAAQLPVVRQKVAVEQHNPKTGDTSLRFIERQLPTSITLQPKGSEGDALSGLPDGVALCPDVKRAIAQQRIRLEREPSKPAASKTAAKSNAPQVPATPKQGAPTSGQSQPAKEN